METAKEKNPELAWKNPAADMANKVLANFAGNLPKASTVVFNETYNQAIEDAARIFDAKVDSYGIQVFPADLVAALIRKLRKA